MQYLRNVAYVELYVHSRAFEMRAASIYTTMICDKHMVEVGRGEQRRRRGGREAEEKVDEFSVHGKMFQLKMCGVRQRYMVRTAY